MLISIRLVSQLSEFAFFGARFRLRTFLFFLFVQKNFDFAPDDRLIVGFDVFVCSQSKATKVFL